MDLRGLIDCKCKEITILKDKMAVICIHFKDTDTLFDVKDDIIKFGISNGLVFKHLCCNKTGIVFKHF